MLCLLKTEKKLFNVFFQPITNTYNSPVKLYSNNSLAEALELKDGDQMDRGSVAQQYTPVAVTYNASAPSGTGSKV